MTLQQIKDKAEKEFPSVKKKLMISDFTAIQREQAAYIKGLTEQINTNPLRIALEMLYKLDDQFYNAESIQDDPTDEEYVAALNLAREALAVDEGKQVWVKTADDLPPPATTLLGYNPKWIDEDFNPEGIRECFMNDDNSWNSAYWDNDQDTWWNDTDTIPTHWMRRPSNPESQPLPSDKGFTALFTDEKEYVAFLKWRRDGGEAVAFAEWAGSELWKYDTAYEKWHNEEHFTLVTTDELYKLFKQKQ